MCPTHELHSGEDGIFNDMGGGMRRDHEATGAAKELHRRKYELWQYGETRPKHTTSLSMARTIK